MPNQNKENITAIGRSSRLEVFCKKVVLLRTPFTEHLRATASVKTAIGVYY